MKKLPYPGLSVRHDCLEPLALSVTEGAKALGVTRQALNNLVNYDLAQAMKKKRSIEVKRVNEEA